LLCEVAGDAVTELTAGDPDTSILTVGPEPLVTVIEPPVLVIDETDPPPVPGVEYATHPTVAPQYK